MKKFVIIAAVAALAMASCAKENTVDNTPVNVDGPVFKATIAPETKTTLVMNSDDNKYTKTEWVANDNISIFGEEAYKEESPYSYEFVAQQGGASTTFTEAWSITDPTLLASEPYALYPYSNQATITSGGVIGTWIGNAQLAVANNFPSNQKPLLVAKSDTEGNLYFYQASALIKFTVADEDVTWITLEGNNNEYLSGCVNISLDLAKDSDKVTTVPNETNDAYKSPTLKVDNNNTAFTTGRVYYMVVTPQTLSKGFTIKWGGTGTHASPSQTKKYTNKAVELNAGTILNLGSISYTDASAPTITLDSERTATVETDYSFSLTFADNVCLADGDDNKVWPMVKIYYYDQQSESDKCPTWSSTVVTYTSTWTVEKTGITDAVYVDVYSQPSVVLTSTLSFSSAGVYEVWVYKSGGGANTDSGDRILDASGNYLSIGSGIKVGVIEVSAQAQ